MINPLILNHCIDSKNFITYNLNNVVLDYARGYLYQPSTIPINERGSRFQGLSLRKFHKTVTSNLEFYDYSIIHNIDNAIYVPTHKNFYHMMIDCMPRLYAAKNDSRPVVMCKTFLDKLPHIFNAIVKWFPATEWKLIDAQPDPITGLSSHSLPGRMIGNNIGMFSNDSKNLSSAFNNNKILAVAFWQQWYKENFSQRVMDKKVFIYREAGDSCERLANQSELANQLEKHGFEIINPVNYTLEEIAVIMNSANTVVGAHGAGLANAIFCQPNVKYIQLANNSGSDMVFENFANICQANYSVIFGYDTLTNLPVDDNRHGNYAVDLDTILAKLS